MGSSSERQKGITIANAFEKVLDDNNLSLELQSQSDHKINKIWVDKNSEF